MEGIAVAVGRGSTVPIARYEWDFGDGDSVSTSGNVVSQVYRTAATREAQVRTVDEDGQTGVGRTTIEVAPRAPLNVNLTADASRTAVGDIVVFTATVSGSTVPITRYEWNFGDGARVATTGNVVNHVYTMVGTREAEVRTVDEDGQTGVGRTTMPCHPAGAVEREPDRRPAPDFGRRHRRVHRHGQRLDRPHRNGTSGASATGPASPPPATS